MMKKPIYIFFLIMLTSLGFSQSKPEVKVTIEATVVDYIEMITLADIDVGTVLPSDETLTLNPRTDQGAGIIALQGRQNASIQISYSALVEMTNINADRGLTVNYSVCGNAENDQAGSALLIANPATVQLNSTGEYYLWIGCSFSLLSIVPGQYDGDFSIEVDYN